MFVGLDARFPEPMILPTQEQAPRVLLLDGASHLTDWVTRAFSSAEFELRVRTSAANLAELVGGFAPDLVLVDVEVEEGGFAVCGELRTLEAARQVPIMLLTKDEADEAMVSRGLLCGADDFVRLSGRFAEFQARARVQLRHKRDRDRALRLRVERDKFRHEASIDALTSLPNRRSTEATIEEEWNRGAPFAVIFVDVDDFKGINDTHGHEAGDQVLREVAGALSSVLRPGDRCGRWGGEEFVVVLPGRSTGDALADAERQRLTVEGLRPPSLKGAGVTASFGVALFDPGAPDASHDVLCQRADAALYEAKRSGKNRVSLARTLFSRGGHVSLKMDRVSLLPRANDRAALETALIRELQSGRAGLPILPEAASEAMALAQDPRTDIARIARLVDRDPPLAARFVAVAGSAVYSRGAKPTSTQAAFVRIGLAAARDLLLQVVYEQTNEDLPAFRAEVAQSFQRSVKAAVAARFLASELRMGYDSAYLCGLLHDIGESRVYRILSRMPSALLMPDFVEELVARHHQRAGADVARAWHLPPELVEVCNNHHTAPGYAPVAVKIVVGADALVRMCDRACDAPVPSDAFGEVKILDAKEESAKVADAQILATLGLSERQVHELVDRVKASLNSGSDSVIPSPPPPSGGGNASSLRPGSSRSVRPRRNRDSDWGSRR